jgi:predicted enzyme related to lactoylglutathione lyase
MAVQYTHINYIEFKAKDLNVIKVFYTKTFGWTFTDYGEDYVAFSNSGLEGGFEKTNDEIVNGVLVVLHHENLDVIQEEIIKAGGKIVVATFSFPGGKRFQFTDPSGNELAVWSKE